jgi:riboflavin kinase/FMN adenylyltransferase
MESRCYHGLSSLPDEMRRCAATIGNFDGVHLGHRRIVQRCREVIGSDGPVLAITFDPSPEQVLRGDGCPPRIDPVEVRCRLLLEAGADAVVLVAAGDTLLGMTPDEFVQKLLMRKVNPAWVVEGANFQYGVGRSGNTATLQAAGRTYGFGVEIVPPVRTEIQGRARRVSSTLVRGLIQQGQVDTAAELLVRPFALYGRVIHGAGQGRSLGWPTANIDPTDQILPGQGVYAGWGWLSDRRLAAAISIGTRPSMDGQGTTVEAHLLDIDEDLYDQPLSLQFVRRLRDQETYDQLDDLKHQIARDIERVRRICT